MHQNKAPKSVETHFGNSGQTAPKKNFTSNLKAQLKDALADRSGNIAIIFGLMLVPTIALIGSSVDFGRAFSVRSQVQAALDSAVLAGGREYQTSQNASLAAQRATDYFTKSIPEELDVVLESVNVDESTKTVTMEARSSVDTTFLGVTGMKKIEVSAESESSFAQSGSDKDLEVALMLDITGSMCMPCTKMTDMKAAANDLIDILVLDDQSDRTSRMAIVPFAQSVNAGQYFGAATGSGGLADASDVFGPKVKVSAYQRFANAFDLSLITSAEARVRIGNGGHGNNCNNNGDHNHDGHGDNGQGNGGHGNGDDHGNNGNNSGDHNGDGHGDNGHGNGHDDDNDNNGNNNGDHNGDGHGDNGQGNGGHDDDHDDDHGGGGGVTPPDYSTTCVVERPGDDAFTDAAPTAGAWLGPWDTKKSQANTPMGGLSCDPANTVVALTDNKTTLHAKVNAMQKAGWTAGHIGTGWASYMLSPEWAAVFGPDHTAAAYDVTKTDKIAVLMTDGEYNTWYENGNGDSPTQAIAVCNEMKAKGIKVYTVGFMLDNATAVSTLATCATSAEDAFVAENGDELRAAFREIGMRLSALRLTK